MTTAMTPVTSISMPQAIVGNASNFITSNFITSSSNATVTYNTPAFSTSSNTFNYDIEWNIQSYPSDELTPDSLVRKIRLQDGTIIHIDGKGNYRIEDKDATVIYKANRMREFNPFVNAGDLLSDFIDYVRQTIPGVRRADIPDLPLQLFVHWLILEAATRDGDDAPSDIVPVPESRLLKGIVKPQCVLPSCRRYIKRRFSTAGFNYCNPQHAGNHGKLLRA